MPSPAPASTARSTFNSAVPPMLPENHPLTMARLQQSARDILRNFETAMTNGSTPSAMTSSSNASLLSKSMAESKNASDASSVPASLEQTLRSMFTSCTFGAGMAASNCDDDDDDETASRTTMQLGGVQKVGTSSTDSSSSIDSPVKPKVKRSKSVSLHPAKKMISSTKDSLRRLASMHIVEASSNTKQTYESSPPQPRRNSSIEPSASSKTAVDHIYEHLFFAEEQARRAAASAVAVTTATSKKDVIVTPTSGHSQRPIVSPTCERDVPPLPDPSSPQTERVGIVPLRRMTQPFPMSKPQNITTNPPVPLMHHQPVHSVSAPNIATIESRNFTFDDDISAISAHTLEAMMMSKPHSQQEQRNKAIFQNGDILLPEPETATDFQFDFPPVVHKVTPSNESAVPMSKAAFCRASTLPRANQANQEREDVERINSLSSSSTMRSKQRISSYNSNDRSNARSPRGFEYGTPSSNRSMASNNSKQQQIQQRFNSSFSPCTSGNSNQSFDRWRNVEQEFWDSVVAHEDDTDDVNEPGFIPSKPKKNKSLSMNRHPSRRSRSRIRSLDGWSEHSTHSRSRDPAATNTDASIFSSSLTGISHSGSSHGTLPPRRSQSWLALHPQNHPHDTFPVIFASTAIPDNDGFYLDHHRPSSSSFPFDAMDSGEI